MCLGKNDMTPFLQVAMAWANQAKCVLKKFSLINILT